MRINIFKLALKTGFLVVLALSIFSCGANKELQNTNPTEKNIRVGFYVQHLSVRGTEVAVYDYADFNEKILNNKSFILYLNSKNSENGNPDRPASVSIKFQKRFGVRFYECKNFEEVEAVILKEKIEVFYNIKSGLKDDVFSKTAKNAVHAVFELEPHGDVYAAISPWVSGLNPSLKVPVVPHMVRLENTNENLRKDLGIPESATVFGRHGGFDSFDIGFTKEAIIEISQKRPDVYFIFLNTEKFSELKNILFLPKTADMVYKRKFINTCDGMIHARTRGETFGLAIAEFSAANKPIITWRDSPETAHIKILGEKAFYYSTKEDLMKVFLNFDQNMADIRGSSWDLYSKQFSPETVMNTFDQVFLQPLAGAWRKENL